MLTVDYTHCDIRARIWRSSLLLLCACSDPPSPEDAWGQTLGALENPDGGGELSYLQQSPGTSDWPTAEKVVCPTCLCVSAPQEPSLDAQAGGRCFSDAECPSGKVCKVSKVLGEYWHANTSCLIKDKQPAPKYCKSLQETGPFGELHPEECSWSTGCFMLGTCGVAKGAAGDICAATKAGCASSLQCVGSVDSYGSAIPKGCSAVIVTEDGWGKPAPECATNLLNGTCVVFPSLKVVKCKVI